MNLEKLEKMASNQNLNGIIDEFTPFIKNFSKKFTLIGYDQDDICQECYLALILCLEKYQKGNNTFVAYATKSVKNHIYNLLRSKNNYKELLCLEENLTFLLKYEVEFIENIELKENKYLLNKAFMKLSIKELHLITYLYYKKRTLSEYSRLLNIQYSLARSQKIKILNKLRENIIFKL